MTDLLELAVSLATEGGALALDARREGVEVAATKSSEVDVVTATDRLVEAFIRRRLEEERPGDGFYGEESDAAESSTGLTWVVDPIDGTVNFLYGIPQWAVSVAVVEGGTDPVSWRILAGCVMNPAGGETFAAARGGGATLNGRPISVGTPASLGLSLVATGFGYRESVRAEQAASIATVLPRVRDIRRLGAASLDLCAVASGRVDAYYERGLKQWDFAAGLLIAEEAGAVVRCDDVRSDRRLVSAVAPSIADDFHALIAEIGA